MAHDAEENANSEEKRSRTEESDLTAFEQEMDELASAIKDLEDILVVQDVEDLREL